MEKSGALWVPNVSNLSNAPKFFESMSRTNKSGLLFIGVKWPLVFRLANRPMVQLIDDVMYRYYSIAQEWYKSNHDDLLNPRWHSETPHGCIIKNHTNIMSGHHYRISQTKSSQIQRIAKTMHSSKFGTKMTHACRRG